MTAIDDEQSLMLNPREVGPYIKEAILGQGGMGVIFKAYHRETEEVVALKTISVPHARSLQCIRSEIHALAQMEHPGIVRIKEHGIQNGLPWYAMDFLEGEAFHHYFQACLSQRSRMLSDILPIMAKVCDSLAYIHSQGIVHKDLKPENIIITEQRKPVIIDFGLMEQLYGQASREKLGVAFTAAGSLHYISPEQIQNQPVDARADLYAIGCMLYEIFTGKPPFTGSDKWDILLGHLKGKLIPPQKLNKKVPDELNELTIKLLAKTPRHRIGFADYVAAKLESYYDSGQIQQPQQYQPYLFRPSICGREKQLDELKINCRIPITV